MNIEQQKEELLKNKASIEKELSSLGRRVSEEGDWVALPDKGDGSLADSIDNADITEDFEEKIAILKVLENRHQHIKKALEAIEEGSYGVCSVCGEAISEDRLRANPSSLSCVEHSS